MPSLPSRPSLPPLPPPPGAQPVTRGFVPFWRPRGARRSRPPAPTAGPPCTSWYGHQMVAATRAGSRVWFCEVCGEQLPTAERPPGCFASWHGHRFALDATGQISCPRCAQLLP